MRARVPVRQGRSRPSVGVHRKGIVRSYFLTSPGAWGCLLRGGQAANAHGFSGECAVHSMAVRFRAHLPCANEFTDRKDLAS